MSCNFISASGFYPWQTTINESINLSITSKVRIIDMCVSSAAVPFYFKNKYMNVFNNYKNMYIYV